MVTARLPRQVAKDRVEQAHYENARVAGGYFGYPSCDPDQDTLIHGNPNDYQPSIAKRCTSSNRLEAR